MYFKSKFFRRVCCALLLPLNGIWAQTDSLPLSMLSFEQAANYMALNNYGLKQHEKEIERKEEEKKAAFGLHLPKVMLSANYAVMSQDITMDLSPVKETITPLYEALGNYGDFSGVPNPDPNTSGFMPILPDDISTQAVRGQLLEGLDHINSANWNTVIQKQQFGVVNANFVLPIYTGGKINAANKAAEIEIEEAKLNHSIKHDELFCELVERYYGLSLANQALQVRKEVLNAMDKHLLEAEKLKTYGMIADAEYLHAKVYHSDAEREYKKANRQTQMLNDALLNCMSLDTFTSVSPVTPLFYLDTISSLELFLTQGEEHNNMLIMVEHKRKLSHVGYAVERSDFLPTIAAMGTYVVADKDLSSMMPDYFVGVGLNWTVFDGTSRIHKLKAAKYQEEKVEDISKQASLNVSLAIHKYYQEVNLLLEQLNDLKTAQNFANEYYRVREKAFSEGMATTTEVLDASLAVAKVKIESLEAVYKYDVALSNLLFYTGTLDQFASYQNHTNANYCNY